MKTMPILLGYRAKEEIANLRELGALEIVIAIPWELIQPHENQAKANHGGQSLERLRERGGLSWSEAACILKNQKWNSIDDFEANEMLSARIKENCNDRGT